MLRVTLSVLLFFAATLSLGAQNVCTTETMTGTYAVHGETQMFLPMQGGVMVMPEVHAGIASFTADGVVRSRLFGTAGGEAFEGTGAGTFVVNEDCTATATVTVQIGTTSSEHIYHYVILDNGNELLNLLFSSPGVRGVGGNTFKRLSRLPADLMEQLSPCTTSMVSGTYAFVYEGDLFVTAPEAAAPVRQHSHMAGLTWIDTAGRMPGKFDFNLAGTVMTGEWTTEPGAVTVNANCTGSLDWNIVAPGNPAGRDRFVVLNGGREIWTVTVKGAMGGPSSFGIMRRISNLPLR